MTMSLRHIVAVSAVAAVPFTVGSAFAQSVPDIPAIELAGLSVDVDLDVPADNGDPIDLTIYIDTPTGESIELPGDVTVPLVEALLGTGTGGSTPDLPLVGDLPVVGDLLGGAGGGATPDLASLLSTLPSDPTSLPVVGDLVSGLLPTEPTSLLDPTSLLGGAGGLPLDPASLPVLGDVLGGAGGAGALPVDLGGLPVIGDVLGGLI